MAYLFEPEPMNRLPENFRRCDPPTSKKAGREHEATGTASAQRYHVLQYVRHHPGCTAKECEQVTRITAHKRMKEIEATGQIKRGPKRPCKVTGKSVITWEPVG